VIGDELWISGGLMLNAIQMSNDFVVYNIPQKKFRPLNSISAPSARYDHSIVHYEVGKNLISIISF
jgi:hypothetical protein